MTCFIFVLAIQPGAIFLSFPFPNNVPFRSDTRDRRGKEKKEHWAPSSKFLLLTKTLDQMDCRDLPRAQLNVRRRTANISMELASSSISVFVLVQQPMAKKCQGNDPQADSVFCFAHYLSVNTLDALVSKTNNYRNKSPRRQNFSRGISKIVKILSRRTPQRLWHSLGQGWEESINNKWRETAAPITMLR